MAPEGVELLQPLQRARGHVFKLTTRDIVKVSKTLSSIGKAAGVVVDSLSGNCLANLPQLMTYAGLLVSAGPAR